MPLRNWFIIWPIKYGHQMGHEVKSKVMTRKEVTLLFSYDDSFNKRQAM